MAGTNCSPQAWAQQLLGECYENGYGVEQDEAKAAELYQLAHRAGYVPATCGRLLRCPPPR